MREWVMAAASQPSNLKLKRWFRFRLRTLLLVTTAFAIWLAFHFSAIRRAERAAERLEISGAEVFYDYQRHNTSVRGDGVGYSHLVEPPGSAAMRRMVGKGFFQVADCINLSGVRTTVEALAPIAQLTSLRVVDLDRCGISDRHLVHIRKLRRIESLNLQSNQITDAGLINLRQLDRLETLSLSKNQIQGDGVRHLLKANALKTLFLRDNPVSDESLAHIAQMADLEMLGLAGSKITDDGLRHLENMTNLKYLGITRTKVTKSGVRSLRERLPKCEIEY
jgi:hypothetical protein